MFVQFDKNRLHLQILCGSLEEYSPSDDIKEAQKRVDALKQKLGKFQEEVVFPEIKEIEAIIEKVNPQPKSEEE